MPAAKTALRLTQTMAYGWAYFAEQHRWCTNGCRDGNGKLIHHRSSALSMLVKSGCNIGYDVECYIGRQMYIENRQAVEVHGDLLKRGLRLSLSEVYHMAGKFLDHLEAVHIDSAMQLRRAMTDSGGYVAHIDATCDKGRGCTFVVLSGWDRWALSSGRVETEHHELITPFLQRAIDMFGAPVGFVSDMGDAMRKAIAGAVLPSGEKPLALVCHYHFGKDVGKDILYRDHEALLSLFRDAKLKKKLQDYVKAISEQMKGKPLQSMVTEWAKDEGAGIPAGDNGIAVLRSLAQKILDYGHDESSKKFPFTRPYLELYDRCCCICAKIGAEINSGRHTGITEKYITRLHNILLPIACSDVFKLVAFILREKAVVFDRLRSVLRLDSKDGCISKTGEADPGAAVLALMETDFNCFIAELREEYENTENIYSKTAAKIILAHFDEYGGCLWGHRVNLIASDGVQFDRYIFRTNNILECYFRPVKRNIRRREGREDVGYSLEHTKASICYVGNLSSQKYLDIVYDGSLENLQNKFALYDIMHDYDYAEVRPTVVTRRGSLPSSDKRIVRNADYTKKALCV